MNNRLLEVGDKIQRFEVLLTKEYDYLYEIINVTKTLAKTKYKTFSRELDFNTKHPENTKNKIIARVYTKESQSWTSADYFLVELT